MGLLEKGLRVSLIVLLMGFLNTAFSQVVLQSDDFSPGPNSWTTNTADAIYGVNCVAGGDNFWTINNIYQGHTGTGIPNTQNQPAGISGSPNSHYLHILNRNFDAASIRNCNYFWQNPSRERYMTKMNGSISTVGFTDVTFSFWWLNLANSDSSGQVFYSLNNGTTWIPTPNRYAGDSTWKKEDLKLPAFDNQASLTFAFVFINPDTGFVPGFAVDDVIITATPSGAPTPNFTEDKRKVCKGDCVQFTDLSTGNPSAWSWDFGTGNAADTSDQQNPSFCFNNVGKYSITLKVGNSAGSGTPLVKPNHIDVVDCNIAPQAQFSMNGVIANTITICSGDTITFADSSAGAVDSRYWSFPGGLNDSGECRIVNDTLSVVKIVYPCAGGEGRDTTYTVTLNVSGLGGATFITKEIVVKSCIGSKARVKGYQSQKKICENDCIELEYDNTIEDEYYISEKPTFKWYVWGIIADSTVWDSNYVYDPNGPLNLPGKTDTMFTESIVKVCYRDSGAFKVSLVTENIYGKDSVVYNDFITVYGHPPVDALVDKPILLRGYSNELTTDNKEEVAGCKLLNEFDIYNGDTALCHNYYWSYKNIFGENITDNIDNWEGQTTRARPESSTWYYVIRENFNGCRSYDSVFVFVDSTYEVGVPDIFSPGSNGTRNSSWYIFGNKITKIDVRVFNRYGQVVYETQKVEDIVWESDIAPVGAGWNGNRNNENGKELDPGVYTYYIKLFHETGETKELSGNVTLVR